MKTVGRLFELALSSNSKRVDTGEPWSLGTYSKGKDHSSLKRARYSRTLFLQANFLLGTPLRELYTWSSSSKASFFLGPPLSRHFTWTTSKQTGLHAHVRCGESRTLQAEWLPMTLFSSVIRARKRFKPTFPYLGSDFFLWCFQLCCFTDVCLMRKYPHRWALILAYQL